MKNSARVSFVLSTLVLSMQASAIDPPKHSSNGRHGNSLPEFIALDPSQAEFPEGVAFDKAGNLFVSIGAGSGPRGAILKFSPSGEKSVLVDFGTPSAAGLAVDSHGDVYVARIIAPDNGVWKADRQGQAARLPGTELIVMPNSLAFDNRGNLFVTETFSFDPPLTQFPNGSAFGRGGIWIIPRRGPARLWLRDDLLTGIAPTLFPYPAGANGIAFYRGHLYVCNTDKSLIVRVPVLNDDQPGQPELWKQLEDVPESVFYQSPFIPPMIDGLAMDVHGNAYIAHPGRMAVVRINAGDLSQETLAAYPIDPLDAPFSLAFGAGKGDRQTLFVTNGGISAMIVPQLPWAGPAVIKVEVGVPGLPLP